MVELWNLCNVMRQTMKVSQGNQSLCLSLIAISFFLIPPAVGEQEYVDVFCTCLHEQAGTLPRCCPCCEDIIYK